MLRPQGYAVLTSVDGATERDTFTCRHCQRIVAVAPRARPDDVGGHCRICDGLICPSCVGQGCTPWEKQMEKIEARDAARRSYGLG